MSRFGRGAQSADIQSLLTTQPLRDDICANAEMALFRELYLFPRTGEQDCGNFPRSTPNGPAEETASTFLTGDWMEYWASLQMYRHIEGRGAPTAHWHARDRILGIWSGSSWTKMLIKTVCRIVSSKSIMWANKISAHVQEGTVWQGLGGAPGLLE